MVSRRDANHGEITEAFEALGCTVHDTHEVGGGFPDIVVGLVGVNVLVEIKTANGKLEGSQIGFIERWRGCKPYIVQTHADVIALVAFIRRQAQKRG